MPSFGAASIACEPNCTPRCWGDFVESALFQTPTNSRPRVQVVRPNEPTFLLAAVWACVVPPSVMQHGVLLCRSRPLDAFQQQFVSLSAPSAARQSDFSQSDAASPRPGRCVGLYHRPHRLGRRFPPPLPWNPWALLRPTNHNYLRSTWSVEMAYRYSQGILSST